MSGSKPKQPAPSEAERLNAELSLKRYEDSRKAFGPVDNALLTPVNKAGELAAVDMATQQINTAQRGATLRDAHRYSGGQVDSRDKAFVDKQAGLQRAKSRADGQNVARTGLRDIELNETARRVEIGQGLAGSAQESLAAAGESQNQAAAASAQRKAANRSQNMQVLGTAAGALATGWIVAGAF